MWLSFRSKGWPLVEITKKDKHNTGMLQRGRGRLIDGGRSIHVTKTAFV